MSGLAHTDDPWTSHAAAAALDPEQRRTLKDALLVLLDGFGPMTGDQLTVAYRNSAHLEGWPIISDLHSVKRRLSELHKTHHVVRSTGRHALSAHGHPAIVWELALSLDQARAAIK